MARHISHLAAGIHLGSSTSQQASAQKHVLELPAQFTGRVRFTLDPIDSVAAIETALRAAAVRETLTEDRVQAYCAQTGKRDHRMEMAVLQEAFHVVCPDVLVERLVADVSAYLNNNLPMEADVDSSFPASAPTRTRIRSGGTLATPYTCTVEREGEYVTLRVRTASAIGPRVVFDPQTQKLVSPLYTPAPKAPVGGTLRLDGTIRDRSGDTKPLRVRWQIDKGTSHEALAERRSAFFAPPLRTVVATLGQSALARFIEAIPTRLSALLDVDCEPTFVSVERFLCLGLLTHKTRVYLLYWRRLRDYLIWSVQHDIA